jgi:SAM-dependent methyltransferase
MPTIKQMLKTNKTTWDKAAPTTDSPRSNLPFWGPYEVKPNFDFDLFIKNKTFLEIGCGSGRSLEHLLENGASSVSGLDLSSSQIKATRKRLAKNHSSKTKLFCQPMEKPVELSEQVDFVISIYALGWTLDLNTTLQNIRTYLKPHGHLIFSWEHPVFNRTWWDGENVVFNRSYFDEKPWMFEDFRNSGPAFIIHRTLQSWHNALIRNNFLIVNYQEPEPVTITSSTHPPHGNYYADQKAQLVPATMMFVCEMT